MSDSYWTQVTNNRLSRRRALSGAATLGAGAAALGLAGCGGGDGAKTTAPKDASGLLSFPQDTTSQAKTGGTFKSLESADVVTLDPIASQSFNARSLIAAYTYPRVMKFVMGKYPEAATGGVEGDIAESFELTADHLQLTLKLRQGLKWDARTPTSSRLIDAQDVVWSMERYRKINPFSADLFYNADSAPLSPIESFSAPDNKTVILKFKAPDAGIMQGLAHGSSGLYIMPREAEDKFDPKGEVRGYGPWLFDEYRPSAGWVWKKAPEYYVKGRPFFDKIDKPIVSEYATRLAQFRAGGVWNSIVTQADVIATKRDLPQTLMRQGDSFGTVPTSLGFGYEGNSPWKDERLRQAVSLLIDREAMLDVFAERERFAKEGLELTVRYHTIVGAGWDGYWVDPTDEKKFGPNAKYLRFDAAEAKKLMTAAGFPNGVESSAFYNGGTNYGADYTRRAEALVAMLNEGGMKIKLGPKEYQNDWLPNYHFGYTSTYHKGQTKTFDGLAYRAPTGYASPVTTLFVNQHKDGSRFEGATPDGRNPQNGDPELNALIEKMKGEFDLKKQQELAGDFARISAKKAYWIQHVPHSTLGFTLVWPVIGNYGLWRSWATTPAITESVLQWWIDSSKPPVGSG